MLGDFLALATPRSIWFSTRTIPFRRPPKTIPTGNLVAYPVGSLEFANWRATIIPLYFITILTGPTATRTLTSSLAPALQNLVYWILISNWQSIILDS